MRTSKYLLYTLKETPKNIDSISHQLMLRAGLIRQSNTGLYTWLPNGIKVLNKIKEIIRYEMNFINAMEMCFPIIQSSKLWKKSNRFQQYGKELITLYDRHNNQFILSPTYEEMITEFVKKEITSYKKFPIIIYQIQKKFRDEIRPRFGIIRAREFLMKDAYSFHKSSISLKKIYNKMYLTYTKIFNKMNLKFYPVKANCGIIGGKYSHEFQAISNSGEDKIIFKKNKNQINQNQLITQKYIIKNFFYKKKIYIKNIFNKKKQYDKILYLMRKKIIKIYIIKNIYDEKNKFIGFIIRNDHILSIKKIKQNKILNITKKNIIFPNILEMKSIIKKIQCQKIHIPIIIDPHVLYLKKIIPLTIINDVYHNFNFLNQYLKSIQVFDIVDIKKSKKKYKIKNCIEIGHIFQIGIKYSRIIDLTIFDKNKLKKIIYMGCYGIGITRLVAAIIEQNHDKNGIIWPNSIAPFQLVIIPINYKNCQKIKNISDNLYYNFQEKNITVLLEDRDEHIKLIFSEMNLIGIPNIIIINSNTIINNTVEYQTRNNITKKKIIHINEIYDLIIKKVYSQ